MRHQNLFEALQNVCGFTAIESDMLEIINAYEKDLKLQQSDISGQLGYSEREVDFAYLVGVFNAVGIDGLHKEIERLKGLGKKPHDIIIAARM
jgi:antirestriction protein ArdC